MKTSENFFAHLQDYTILYRDSRSSVAQPLSYAGLKPLMSNDFLAETHLISRAYSCKHIYVIRSKNNGIGFVIICGFYRTVIQFGVFPINPFSYNETFSSVINRYPHACKFLKKLWIDQILKLHETQETGLEELVLSYLLEIEQKKCEKLEHIILEGSVHTLMQYIRMYHKKRFPEIEHRLLEFPGYCVEYAHNYIKGPWKKAEGSIAQSADSSVEYAITVLRKRFLLGEKAIKKSFSLYRKYIQHFGLKYL